MLHGLFDSGLYHMAPFLLVSHIVYCAGKCRTMISVWYALRTIHYSQGHAASDVYLNVSYTS